MHMPPTLNTLASCIAPPRSRASGANGQRRCHRAADVRGGEKPKRPRPRQRFHAPERCTSPCRNDEQSLRPIERLAARPMYPATAYASMPSARNALTLSRDVRFAPCVLLRVSLTPRASYPTWEKLRPSIPHATGPPPTSRATL